MNMSPFQIAPDSLLSYFMSFLSLVSQFFIEMFKTSHLCVLKILLHTKPKFITSYDSSETLNRSMS